LFSWQVKENLPLFPFLNLFSLSSQRLHKESFPEERETQYQCACPEVNGKVHETLVLFTLAMDKNMAIIRKFYHLYNINVITGVYESYILLNKEIENIFEYV